MITSVSFVLALFASLTYTITGDSSCAYPLALGIIGTFAGLFIESKSNPFNI